MPKVIKSRTCMFLTAYTNLTVHVCVIVTFLWWLCFKFKGKWPLLKKRKKTNMTHTNVNQINDNNMQLVQVLMESSVYAFVQNNIWSIWWSCLLMVLLYKAEMESIWCPLMYTMTASWSVLTHSFVHANKNKRKKKKTWASPSTVSWAVWCHQ